MPRKSKGELVKVDDGPIKISEIQRPKTSRPFSDMFAPVPITAKPLNKSAAKGILKEQEDRERYERYISLVAMYNGNYVRALCALEGIEYRLEGEPSIEQANMEANWWIAHREICSKGAQHVNEAEFVRSIGADRASRWATLARFMHAGSEQAALVAIREMNKMEDSDMVQSGDSWDDYALMLLEDN